MTFCSRVNIARTPSSPRTLSSRWEANGSRSRVTARQWRSSRLLRRTEATVENLSQRKDFDVSEFIETIIVGGGQAGLAISYYLKQEGREHLVLERAPAIANAWRNQRWNSFTLVTPNFQVRMPRAKYSGKRARRCELSIPYIRRDGSRKSRRPASRVTVSHCLSISSGTPAAFVILPRS